MKHQILILVQTAHDRIHPVCFELLGKARQLSTGDTEVACLALDGGNIDYQELFACGCDRVYAIQDPCFQVPLEELYVQNIVPFLRDRQPHMILIGATNFGRSLAPRIAAAMDTGLTADCTRLELDDSGSLVQIRPAFSGNIMAHIKSVRLPQMATIRFKEFPEPPRDFSRPVSVVQIPPVVTAYEKSRVLSQSPLSAANLTDSDVIVAVGRGLRRKEDLSLAQNLAALLGGQLAVSRALVDAGMADSAIQVGYSGHRVKPRLYLACGISGAPQHVAGMKESDTIVAINTDPSAPIFSHCHYGMVGDLYEILPRMTADIKAGKGGAL